jgi:hypothetical protein
VIIVLSFTYFVRQHGGIRATIRETYHKLAAACAMVVLKFTRTEACHAITDVLAARCG